MEEKKREENCGDPDSSIQRTDQGELLLPLTNAINAYILFTLLHSQSLLNYIGKQPICE